MKSIGSLDQLSQYSTIGAGYGYVGGLAQGCSSNRAFDVHNQIARELW